MADYDPKKTIAIEISLAPLQAMATALTEDQVCRLLAQVGNQVTTWLRYDVKASGNIPVVCHEGNQNWRSEDGKCRANKPE